MFAIFGTVVLVSSVIILGTTIFCCQAYINNILKETQSNITTAEILIKKKKHSQKFIQFGEREKRNISTKTYLPLDIEIV